MSYPKVSISISFVQGISNRVKTLVPYPRTALVLSFMIFLITASI